MNIVAIICSYSKNILAMYFQFMNRNFLRNMGLTFLGCLILILLCYFYLDPIIAYKLTGGQFDHYLFLQWIGQIAVVFYFSAFFLLIMMGIKGARKPLSKIEEYLFTFGAAASASVLLKDAFKIIFGRLWPETWYMNNPSLIKNQAYGFHFWNFNYPFGAFPSGHTTVVFCAMTFMWVLAPKWRWLAILICLLQVIPLLLLNYHFLSDIIAGAFLGFCCAIFAIKINISPQ